MSREEEYLKHIISSCELILDDMDQGGKISQANFNMLGYCDGIMFRMQQELSKQLNPTHYKEMGDNQALWESTGGRSDA
jgi:hypothetical protein|tara:strand:+ start:1045 stop:1281 length:237 start_codon:yes stop_codon:yes gene_type:complete